METSESRLSLKLFLRSKMFVQLLLQQIFDHFTSNWKIEMAC